MPRVEGRALVHTLDFVTAQARAASDSGAASVVDHASALLEYDAAIKALSVKQVRQLCGHGWESGGEAICGVICHECAGVRGWRDTRRCIRLLNSRAFFLFPHVITS